MLVPCLMGMPMVDEYDVTVSYLKIIFFGV